MTSEFLSIGIAVIFCGLTFALWVQIRALNKGSGSESTAMIDPEVYLQPVRERLKEIQGKIEDSRTDTAGNSARVVAELKSVLTNQGELRQQGVDLSEKTSIIASSLKGSGVAGDWGELQLRRTLEIAKMTEHVTFSEEIIFEGSEGQIKPDILVHLLGDKNIIIDAKAPKIDFDENPDAAKKQAAALETHIKKLSEKNYPTHVPNSLDFVILFVPTEGILATALTEKPKLLQDAAEKRILLASPMTLLAILKAIEYGWRQAEQEKNTKLILKETSELLDLLVEFVSKWNIAAGGLKTAVRNFNEASSYFDNSLRRQYGLIRDLKVNISTEMESSVEIISDVREVKWDS